MELLTWKVWMKTIKSITKRWEVSKRSGTYSLNPSKVTLFFGKSRLELLTEQVIDNGHETVYSSVSYNDNIYNKAFYLSGNSVISLAQNWPFSLLMNFNSRKNSLTAFSTPEKLHKKCQNDDIIPNFGNAIPFYHLYSLYLLDNIIVVTYIVTYHTTHYRKR